MMRVFAIVALLLAGCAAGPERKGQAALACALCEAAGGYVPCGCCDCCSAGNDRCCCLHVDKCPCPPKDPTAR
jgi:hypothetical protein